MGGNNSVLATQQLSELSTELSRVRANRASAEATADSVRKALQNGGSLDAVPEVLSSDLIQRLRERQVELRANIADLSTTLLDNHPRIRALRSQLADLDGQIRNEAQKVMKGLLTQAQTAQARENQLISDVNTLKAASARAGEEQVELDALQREATAQRQQLEFYHDQLPRGGLAQGPQLSAGRRQRVFRRRACRPSPISPRSCRSSARPSSASLLLMAVVTLLRELFSGRAMRPAPGARFERIEQVAMPAMSAPAVEPANRPAVAEAIGGRP